MFDLYEYSYDVDNFCQSMSILFEKNNDHQGDPVKK